MRRLIHKIKRGILRLGALAHRHETCDALVLLLVGAAGWWMAAQQGGARAESMPVALRLLLGAVAIHGASLLLRQDEGIGLGRIGLAGLPFLAWLAADAILIAPDRGRAMHGLVIALMLAVAWYLTVHHARRTWSCLAAAAMLAAPGSILACGAFDPDDRHIRGLLGMSSNPAYAGHFVSAIGSPGACAAVMLLGLMPPLAIAVNPSLRRWNRVVAAYFAGLLLLGLVGTHHAWGLLAFGAGVIVLAWTVCRSRKTQIGLTAATAIAGWWLAGDALVRVGILRQAPGDAGGATWLARGAGEALASHPLVGGGDGSFPLSFEAVRPAAWQTDPATCGSLPVQLACEHGLLGLLLILVPACWVAWRSLRTVLAPPQLSDEAITASGGRGRAALRRSLCAGTAIGSIGAALILAVDYPASLPGVLMLLLVSAAIAYRLAEEDRAAPSPDGVVRLAGLACLVAPALAAPLLLSPLESAALSANAAETVAHYSPTGLAAPSLLDAASQAELAEAAEKLGRACRLNPLDGEAHAWHAQSLALLIRQSPEDRELQGRAHKVAERAAELSPRAAWSQAVLGSILLGSSDARDRARGLSNLRNAARIAPMNQSIALRFAQALGQAGATQAELLEAYERAQLTNPTRTEVRDKITLLRSSGNPATPSR